MSEDAGSGTDAAARGRGPRAAEGATGRWVRVGRWARRLGLVAFAVAVALFVTPRLGSSVSGVGPGEVSIGFSPTLQGRTTLALPPVGEASAHTHRGPVEVRLELRSLDVAKLLGDGGRIDTETLNAAIRDDLGTAVRDAALRFVFLAAAVGAVAGAILPRRKPTTIVSSAVVSGLVAAVVAASALPGFDVAKFDDLTYEGPVNAGTQLLKTLTAETGVVGQRVDALSNKLVGLYSATITDALNDEDEVVILHISDLHLNPIGARLARDLAESFDVDAVVDTGDTTSFGSRFEGRFAELLSNFPVPYYWVAGNHDSLPNRAAIKATSGITSIHRRVVEVEGVRILGFDDPLVTTGEDVPREERERIEAEAAPALRRLVRRERPDIVAVHNPVILQTIVGEVPLALAGHQHEAKRGVRKGTIVSVVGSTGATGLGSLLAETDVPASADLMRFRGGELVAIDRLEVIGVSGDLVVQRRTITEADYEGDTAGFIGRDVDEAIEPEVDPDDTTTTTTSTSTSTSTATSRDPGGDVEEPLDLTTTTGP